MPDATADVVICGAGISGISVAHELACRRGITDVVLVDEKPPLSLTSDKSTECYRNWWPGPGTAMVELTNRSIDRLEELAAETGNAFHLSPAGYVYLSGTPSGAREMEAWAREVAGLGAGELRVHRGEPDDPPFHPEAAAGTAGARGADLVLEPSLLHERFPGLTPDLAAGILVRRAGWVSAQQLGMVLLERAREAGVRLVSGKLTAVEATNGRVEAVRLSSPEARISTRRFVNAAGPMAPEIARLLEVALPTFQELHAKATFDDHLGVLPRDLPLMIWNDPITLDWSDEERRELADDPELSWLLEELPGGAHLRPEGGEGSTRVLMLWAYHTPPTGLRFPPSFDPLYAQVTLRGLARMFPELSVYFERGRRPWVDGGYYTKTRENRPLVGPAGPEGSYLLGAVSGYGIMVSQGAAELLADHLTGGELPTYASAFRLERYEDPEYVDRFRDAGASRGQL